MNNSFKINYLVICVFFVMQRMKISKVAILKGSLFQYIKFNGALFSTS